MFQYDWKIWFGIQVLIGIFPGIPESNNHHSFDTCDRSHKRESQRATPVPVRGMTWTMHEPAFTHSLGTWKYSFSVAERQR